MMHVRWLFAMLPVAVAGIAALSACGSSSTSSSSPAGSAGNVVFTGTITGAWHKGGDASESTCGTDSALIHIVGPAEGDEGNLKISSDGRVLVDIEKSGDFNANSGGTLHAGQGFDVNADVASARGKTAHVSGSLSC
jgi:hypothetical protein